MKRALLLALVLLALALFVLLRPHAPRAAALSAQGREEALAPAIPAEAIEDAALDAPASTPQATRASLAAESQADEAGSSSVPASEQALVRVKVLYAGSRAPVKGAVVKLRPRSTANTDAKGVADLHLPLPAALELVRIDPAEGGDLFVPYEHTLDQRLEQGRFNLEVQVDRGVDLRGVVRDAATGRPVAQAQLRYRGFGYRTNATSRDDGSFEFQALLAGASNTPGPVIAEHPDFLPGQVRPELADLDSRAPPLQLLLQRGIRVSGRVVNEEHLPLAGVELVLLTTGAYPARTDENGRFEIGSLAMTETATLRLGTQAHGESALIGTQLDLGPILTSRSDIEFEVQTGLQLRVFAELSDGTQLESWLFSIRCSGTAEQDLATLVRFEDDTQLLHEQRLVARGPEVDIDVFGRAPGETDPGAYLHGKARVRTDRGVVSPLEVHIRLDERGQMQIPKAPEGAQEIEIGVRSPVKGAIDVQVLDDASGRPIGQGLVFMQQVGLMQRRELPPEGWLRLRAMPGTYVVHAGLEQDALGEFVVTIPPTGYAKTEWRLRSKP